VRTSRGSGGAGRRRRRGTAALATVALVGAAFLPQAAVAQQDDDQTLGTARDFGVSVEPSAKLKDDVVTGAVPAADAYFLQLRARPTIAGGDDVVVAAQQAKVLREARRAGADLEVRHTYDSVWNGIAVEADRADVILAARSADVVAVYPVYLIEGPEPLEKTDGPHVESATRMTGVNRAQRTLEVTGEGRRIGIIDTGVDVDHPDLGGSGTPGNGVGGGWRSDKVQFGRDLVGDSFNPDPGAKNYDPVPQPDGNPDDCNGHGTHVAGIAAANGDPKEDGVRGVAPDAVIGAYRVFGCEGPTTADIMLAAMEAAYDDGMDVVNISVGAPFAAWPQYPTAAAADAMVDAGITVVASIGNNGANGLFSASAPGVGEKVIGVASFDNVMVTVSAVKVGAEETEVGYVRAGGAPAAPRAGTATLTRLGAPDTVAARGCTASGGISADLTDTVVLIERGDCGFHEKAANAQTAGADAVILYNNQPGLVSPSVTPPGAEDPEITIPVIMVQQSDGRRISQLIGSGDRALTWTAGTVTMPGPNGGLVSSFSSYGLTAELDIKPDLGAPGGNIWSTFPVELGSYGTSSGTSMAAPHVAGAVALLQQARPELSPTQIRDVLQNTADPALWSLNSSYGLLEGVFRQGAGLIDVDDAIEATTLVTPGKLPLGESGDGPHEVTLRVTNTGTEPVTYAVRNNAETVAAGGQSTNPTFATARAQMTGPSEVTVQPGATATVRLELTPPTLTGYLYSGWIELLPDGRGAPLRVPYAGYAGDYQEARLFTPGSVGVDLPVLAQLTDCDRVVDGRCAAGGSYKTYPETGSGDVPVYSLADGDVPTVLAHLRHQVRALSITAYRANPDGSRGQRIGVVEALEYLPRSASGTTVLTFAWDGRWQGEPVPDGRYLLEIAALKPLGDLSNADHVETWQSPPFSIRSEVELSSPTVNRLGGADRYGTAARVAATYPPGVEVAYVAAGEDFPDALAGAALAGTQGAPVLLVRHGGIPRDTAAELQRLRPKSIVVLGGEGAVSGRVLAQLRTYTDGPVTRIAGENRFQTAALVAAEFGSGVDTVFVADGNTFPDALAGAARGGAVGSPVLLVRPDHVPAVTRAALESLQPERVVVLGGPKAVSAEVAEQLRAYGQVVRVSGDTRYETAAAVAGYFGHDLDAVYIATGESFPDALAGAARAGHQKVPVLLVPGTSVPAATRAELERIRPREVVVLGGPGVVSEDVLDEIAAMTFRR
jgi:minor extracellular serine protease Vpr